MADLVDRNSAIDSIEHLLRQGDELYPLTETDRIMNHALEIAASCVYNLPSAQPDIVEKILAAGKEGKEARIYIGGRLFAVRELAQ